MKYSTLDSATFCLSSSCAFSKALVCSSSNFLCFSAAFSFSVASLDEDAYDTRPATKRPNAVTIATNGNAFRAVAKNPVETAAPSAATASPTNAASAAAVVTAT